MRKPLKNYAFIDSQNIYLSIKRQGWKVDFYKFRIYLEENYEVQKAFLFIGYIEGNNDLYTSLQEVGFICIFKPTLKNRDGTIKGNVDAELVLQVMHEINNFEKAVIATGDGDFYCLVKYLRNRNKLKVLLVPDRNRYSVLLKRFAKKNVAFMNDLKDLISVD